MDYIHVYVYLIILSKYVDFLYVDAVSFHLLDILRVMGLSMGVILSWSAQNELDKTNNFEHREQRKEIASLTYVLGTRDTKTFIQQHRLIKHAYK